MSETRRPLTPWGLHPLPLWIGDELDRRSKDYGMNPVEQNQGTYSGPRTAWVRVFSNGISKDEKARYLDGFVLFGAEGFEESYGFNSRKETVVGVDSYGNKHIVSEESIRQTPDFPHRPPPNISSVDCELSGAANSGFPASHRKIRIDWKCYSLNQLNYLVPYLLSPRITLLVEWGWNNYDKTSLIDLTDKDWLRGVFIGRKDRTTEWIEKSNGNYDLGMGYIVDYGYEMMENGGYNCHTTIQSANYLVEGQSFKNRSYFIKTDDTPGAQIGNGQQSQNNKNQLSNFTEYIDDIENLAKNNGVTEEFKTKFKDRFGYSVEYVDGKIFWPKSVASKKESSLKDSSPWIRMDLVSDIINKFFSIELITSSTSNSQPQGNNSNSNVKITKFEIDDVIMVGHPALKSVDPDILFPNQYAPRFLTVDVGRGLQLTENQRRRVDEIRNQMSQAENVRGNESALNGGSSGERAARGSEALMMDMLRKDSINQALQEGKDTGQTPEQINAAAEELSRETRSSDTVVLPAYVVSEKFTDESLVRITSVEYKNLFNAYTQKYGLSNDYDDLYDLINKKAEGKSFPVYTEYIPKDENGRQIPGNIPSGYWGRLKDVYISTSLLKDLIQNNDNILRFIEVLLQKISAATCNISRLRLSSPQYSNGFYTVRDDNISFIRTATHAKNLLRISVGSINQSFLKTAEFSLSISSDMVNQLIAQSAQRGSVTSTDSTTGNIPSTVIPTGDRFASSDRLYQDRLFPGGMTNDRSIPVSETSPDSDKFVFLRKLPDSGGSSAKDFKYLIAKDEKSYILFEPDNSFLKRVLWDQKDKNATYINNRLMPASKFTMELLGISGINFLSQFTLDHVPDPYTYKHAVWQVNQVKHKIENKNWITIISAEVRPLTIV